MNQRPTPVPADALAPAGPPARQPRPIGGGAAAVMVMLCASWGLNQVAVKLALPDIPALIQATLRSVGALVFVAVMASTRGVPLFARDGTLWFGVGAGILFSLEFICVYCGLTLTTASRAVVFLYTAPFFVALGARFLLGEAASWMQWAGLAMSFLGVALAIGVPQPSVDAHMLFGDGLIIVGAACWAATTLLIKGTRLLYAPAEKAMAYQLAVSIPILALAALALGETMTAMPGTPALLWLAYQTFWVVAITYTIWFAMVTLYSANGLSSFTFLTPLIGVAAGHFLLGEPLSPVFAVAAVLVLGGLILVNKPR